jgi:hypothetical protein
VPDVLALRQRTELVKRFAPPTNAGGHAVVQLTGEIIAVLWDTNATAAAAAAGKLGCAAQ